MHHLPAYHHGGQLAFRHLPRLRKAHQLPLAHHPHPVGNGHDLIELVGNEDDGHALLPDHSPEDIKELIGLLRGEDGGRLVQNQNVRPRYKVFKISTRCCRPTLSSPPPGLRIHPQAILLRQRRTCSLAAARSQKAQHAGAPGLKQCSGPR